LFVRNSSFLVHLMVFVVSPRFAVPEKYLTSLPDGGPGTRNGQG
jgi:hypothetical protein